MNLQITPFETYGPISQTASWNYRVYMHGIIEYITLDNTVHILDNTVHIYLYSIIPAIIFIYSILPDPNSNFPIEQIMITTEQDRPV